MAKIVITIEDLPSGGVRVQSTPTAEQMITLASNGHKLTSAHGYAFQALNAIREESRRKDPTKVIIPRLAK